MKRIALLGLIGLLPFTSFAADKDNAFAPKGAGMLSCEAFVKIAESKGPDAARMLGWIEGYITAVNQTAADTYDVAPWQPAELLGDVILNHCRKNPKDSVFAVNRALISSLAKDRLTTKSEIIEIKEGDAKGAMYAETLKRAQVALKDKGVFSGTADGKWGGKTRDALKAFQKKEGIQETGLPDAYTLVRLFQPSNGGQPAPK